MKHHHRWSTSPITIIIILSVFIDTVNCCLTTSTTSLASSRSAAAAASARAAAAAAPTHLEQQSDGPHPTLASTAICASVGMYQANELHKTATLVTLPGFSELKVADGGRVTCAFNPDEFCSWYSAHSGIGRRQLNVYRARFETVFDLDRFDCTSERRFNPDGYFLTAGGESSTHDMAAIETEIPCQLGTAKILFDYWTTSDRPYLQLCTISVSQKEETAECQSAVLSANPLQFTIPESFEPFTIRIEISKLSPHDIVFIDNMLYEGQICELSDEIQVENTLKIEDEDNNIDDKFIDELDEELDNETTRDEMELQTKEKSADVQTPDVCDSVQCNFNKGTTCQYKISGLGSTDEWKIGEGRQGNRLTGIQRRNDNDPVGGYLYVGIHAMDTSDQIYVLESSMFRLSQPTTLLFDVYQRSIGPKLKVCIDGFDNCPYDNPPININKYWFMDQRVELDAGTHQVFFIATGFRSNLYLAIDNIRLSKFCQTSPSIVNQSSASPPPSSIASVDFRRRSNYQRHDKNNYRRRQQTGNAMRASLKSLSRRHHWGY